MARTARGPLDRSVLRLSASLRTHLIVSTVVAVGVALAIVVQAEAISRLLPRLVDGDGAAVAPLVSWLLLVGAVRAVADAVTEGSAARALIATRKDVRRDVLDRLATLRIDARDELGPARVGGLTTTAIDALEPWVRAYLPGLVLAVIVPLAAGLRILQADLVSAAVLLVVVPLIPIFMVLIGRATETQAATQWATLQRLAARFLDTLTGLPTLRLFGRADAQVERIRGVTERYRHATLRTLRIAFLSALVLEVLATLSVALVAVSLGVRLIEGGMDLRTALLVLLLAPECLLPLRRVSAAFHAATAGVDAATDVDAALALPLRAEGDSPVPAIGRLTAAGVVVVDPVRGVRLPPVDLSVAGGELVAITGGSGAGKSTLLDVLRGAIPPDRGRVQLGSVSVSDLQGAARATAITWVPQHPRPLGATVAGSAGIGHGDDPVTEAAVALALDQVGLAALAGAAPAELSGGERRRLALARALVGVHLGTCRYLLVDEPTAQLDAASAHLVVESLRWACESGVGVAVATHDDALVSVADREVAVDSPTAAAEPFPGRSSPAERTPERMSPPPRVVAAVPGWTGPPPVVADDGRGALRWLLAVASPVRGRLVLAQALGVGAEACTIGLAGTAAWLVVRAAERPSFAALAVAAVAVRGFGISKGILRYAERLASHDAALRFLADLRATVVGRLAHLSPTGLPRVPRGDLLSRLVDDVDRLQDLFLRVMGPLIASLAVAAGAAAVAAVLDVGAGLVIASAVGVVGVLLPALSYAGARRRGTTTAGARGEVASMTVDLAEHVEELMACGGEPAWREHIEEAASRLDRLELAQARSTAFVSAVAAAAPALATAGVVAATGPAGPSVSGPVLGVLVLLPLAVLELVRPLATTGDMLAGVAAAAGRVQAVLQRPDPVAEPLVPAAAPDRGDLALEDVSFAWPGSLPQVAGIDLVVTEGTRVAITGPSGSGKSTVAAGLVRFLEPVVGDYSVGGCPAEALGGDGVRRLVTWCQQEPWFADTTLADNLRIAMPTASDEQLWTVLRTVHLDEWARRLPSGLATPLSRDADAMSGGERQRLSLARALLGGQRAMVLDEPTAHLDHETGKAVMDDLLAATFDRAVVLITHDPHVAGIDRHRRLAPQRSGPSIWGQRTELPTPPGIDDHHLG